MESQLPLILYILTTASKTILKGPCHEIEFKYFDKKGYFRGP
jgi:hypothetical protein